MAQLERRLARLEQAADTGLLALFLVPEDWNGPDSDLKALLPPQAGPDTKIWAQECEDQTEPVLGFLGRGQDLMDQIETEGTRTL